MLRIWLGAIKARTFQVKAETTSLTLTHPIVPGYCSCWKGKIRAVTVWRVNECWGTLKSMIIWLLHTTHWIHVLAILMQSLLGEEKKYPSGCICTVTGVLEKVKGPLALINARSIPGECEEQHESEELTQNTCDQCMDQRTSRQEVRVLKQVNTSPFCGFSFKNFSVEGLLDKKGMP